MKKDNSDNRCRSFFRITLTVALEYKSYKQTFLYSVAIRCLFDNDIASYISCADQYQDYGFGGMQLKIEMNQPIGIRLPEPLER
jgi:hypothetical protein